MMLYYMRPKISSSRIKGVMIQTTSAEPGRAAIHGRVQASNDASELWLETNEREILPKQSKPLRVSNKAYAIIHFSPAWFRGNDVIPFYGQVLITNQQNSL
jgi:hypothetical protein